MAFRFDRGSLKSPVRLDDGRIKVDAVISRSGVFPYTNPDGSTRLEYRPPSEVFSPVSMNSFELVAITDNHPIEGEVTAHTAQALAKGWTGENVRQDGLLLLASMMISDPAAILSLESGKTATSCGYHMDLDETPGVSPEGVRYDCVQRNIRGNHVALVDAGRAGVMARVRMDSVAEMLETQPKANKMDPELLKALAASATLQVRLDAAEATITELKTDLAASVEIATTAQAERDSQTVRADKAEALRTDGAELSKLVQARAALEKTSLAMINDVEYSAEGKTDLDLRVDALTARESFVFDVEKHDAKYVSVRFDSALLYFEREEDPYRGLVKADPEARTDSKHDERSSYEKMIERNAQSAAPKGKE